VTRSVTSLYRPLKKEMLALLRARDEMARQNQNVAIRWIGRKPKEEVADSRRARLGRRKQTKALGDQPGSRARRLQ
jgi:hypothetical protein